MLPIFDLAMANPIRLIESPTLMPLSYEARSQITQKDVQLHSDLAGKPCGQL